MANNSYGFDFLKSEHVLSNNSSNPQYSQYDTAVVVSQSSTDDDYNNNNNDHDGTLPMDDESFRYRERIAVSKPALEKQFDILAFLQKHTRGSAANNYNNNNDSHSSHHHHHTKCLPPNIIYRATGIDIQGDTTVHTMLQNNPKIIIEYIPDPENPTLSIPHYGYQAKYPNVVDRVSLIAQINRSNQGIPMIRDLYDCYFGIDQDIAACICAGDIIAITNNDDRDKILFPRGDLFLTELDGIVTIPISAQLPEDNYVVDLVDTTSTGSRTMATTSSINEQSQTVLQMETIASSSTTTTITTDEKLSKVTSDLLLNGNGSQSATTYLNNNKKSMREVYIVDTDIDPRKQIRRGEAVQMGGQWFRISSAIKAGIPLSEQPVRAHAPLSVVSYTDLSSRNDVDGYIRPFTNQQIPLDDTLNTTAQSNILSAKNARENLMKVAQQQSIGGGGGGTSSGGTAGAGSRHNSNSTGGIIGQLTGSYAHSSNPTTLAASLSSTAQHHHHHASSTLHNHHRKRPTTTMMSSSFNNNNNLQQRLSSSSIVSSKVALEKAAADPALALYNHARRHGCTKDIRDMYFATRKHVPESDHDVQRLLVEYKLLEPNETMRRPRLKNIKSLSQSDASNLDNDGKPKKRRYYERKNQRMTNTHLEGTEIGALLALAAEKQKQGKSVGDGGI